jgi:molybdenum cofactor synthesis domain-containing protein
MTTDETTVAVLTVGDELLTGQTENTNATWLARQLHARGATVARVEVVPDDRSAIAATVNRLRSTHDAVIVTGGVGPTHDDVTMEAIADAFDVGLAEQQAVLDWFENETDYARSDLVDGTTAIPEQATFLPNPAGVAPGARIENVFVLPGVPEEMKGMFELIADHFEGPETTVTVLTSERPESELVDALRTASERFNVRIGSYPGTVVTVRIQGQDAAVVDAAAEWLADRL